MRFAALFAAVALAAACGVSPDPDSLSQPRIEQIQPAAFMSAQVEFKAVDDGATPIKDLVKEVALERRKEAASLGITGEVEQWTTDEAPAVVSYYLTGPSPEVVRELVGDRLPDDRDLAFGKTAPDRWRTYVVTHDAALDGADIATANLVGGDTDALSIAFTPDGAEKLSDLTASIAGHKLAVLIDGTVAAAPVVQSRIDGGTAQITLAP
jgi:preprotein translocase subunit SecD